jgi:hypothetical protein
MAGKATELSCCHIDLSSDTNTYIVLICSNRVRRFAEKMFSLFVLILSLISLMGRIRAGQSKTVVSIPGRGKKYLLQSAPDLLLNPPSLLCNRCWGIFPLG